MTAEPDSPVGNRTAGTRSDCFSFPAQTALHALVWLVLGNAVGALLSLLLLFPAANAALAPYTYGRWVPLHLNFHLYGWGSIPLLGLLMQWMFSRRLRSTLLPAAIFSLWSLALAAGALTWLQGETSGKLFLDWSGAPKTLFIAELWLLFAVFAVAFVLDLATESRRAARVHILKVLLLASLAVVPLAFLEVLKPGVNPPIDAATGGATGAALVISTLGVVAIAWIFPLLVVQRVPIHDPRRLRLAAVPLLLIAHTAGWLLLNHHNSSNADLDQEIGMVSLLPWGPVLFWYYRNFLWFTETRRWLASAFVWGSILLLTATAMFFPPVLTRIKFTDALVAHVHLAMSGMLLSLAMLMIVQFDHAAQFRKVLGSRRLYWLWHLGLMLFLIASGTLAYRQMGYPAASFEETPLRTFCYSLRLAGGSMLLLVSLSWLFGVQKALAAGRSRDDNGTAG